MPTGIFDLIILQLLLQFQDKSILLPLLDQLGEGLPRPVRLPRVRTAVMQFGKNRLMNGRFAPLVLLPCRDRPIGSAPVRPARND